MWESCAHKQLHCTINIILQSDIPVPKLLWLRQLSIASAGWWRIAHDPASFGAVLNADTAQFPQS